jgi:hypothetical protein
MIQERNVGEWATVYEDEVEGRLVAVKLYSGTKSRMKMKAWP